MKPVLILKRRRRRRPLVSLAHVCLIVFVVASSGCLGLCRVVHDRAFLLAALVLVRHVVVVCSWGCESNLAGYREAKPAFFVVLKKTNTRSRPRLPRGRAAFVRKSMSDDRFRKMATEFARAPSVAKRATLLEACERLRPDQARQIYSEVYQAYSGSPVAWLAQPNALSVLFDVGDLIDRIADAAVADTQHTTTLNETRRAAVARAEALRQQHLLHVEALELERLSATRRATRNAAAFGRMQASNFALCTDAKVRTVLSASDAFLQRQPPLWWSDVRIEACSSDVRRALVHRLHMLVARRGRSALPASVHETVQDIARRSDTSDCGEDSADAQHASKVVVVQTRAPVRYRWARYVLSWIFPTSFWRRS